MKDVTQDRLKESDLIEVNAVKYQALSVYRAPVGKYGNINGNGREYPKELYVNIRNNQKDIYEGCAGLKDHPLDLDEKGSDGYPEGQVKHIFCVWHEYEVDNDGVVYSFMYVIDEQADKFIKAGGKLELSMDGYGEFIPDRYGKLSNKVNPDTYRLTRVADWVFRASQHISVTLKDQVQPDNMKESKKFVEKLKESILNWDVYLQDAPEATRDQLISYYSNIKKNKDNLNLDSNEIEDLKQFEVALSKINLKLRENIGLDNYIESKIIHFFENNPNPNCEQINNFVIGNGLDTNFFQERLYEFISTFICGGKSYNSLVKYDEEQISKGLSIEKEHVNDNSPFAKYIQEKITKDHLFESLDKKNPRYNSMLLLMEKMLDLGITEDQLIEKFPELKEKDEPSLKELTLQEKIKKRYVESSKKYRNKFK